MGRGKFITFEGGEGTGKSTQIEHLRAALIAAGVSVKTTREPGGFPEGDMIRNIFLEGDANRWDPVSEALLMFASRKEHVVKIIEPSLAQGTWVISDRFSDSTMAYQGYARGLGTQFVADLHQLTLGNFEPDLTLVLDLNVEDSLARMKASGGGHDRMERQGREFHDQLRAAFRAIASENASRCRVIDASHSEDEIAAAVWVHVSALIDEA